MLNLLDAMSRWAAEHASADKTASVKHRRGRQDVAKQSADVGFESRSALGTVAVWESGELEAEVLQIPSGKRLFVLSGVVHDSGELRQVLDRVYQLTRRGAL